jgi:hypothetical protein
MPLRDELKRKCGEKRDILHDFEEEHFSIRLLTTTGFARHSTLLCPLERYMLRESILHK